MNDASQRARPPLPRVVIVGAGFGGLWAARALARAPVELIVIDRTNHHLFQPLLYQVATAGLSAPAISAPIRRVLAGQANTTVWLGEVRGIDASSRTVLLEGGERLRYDELILAAGASHSYFGNDSWAPHAPGLKTLADAFEIRRRILVAFEQAERVADAGRRRAWLNFVVIGAGATGVELAGTLAEIARHTLAGEFRSFDPRSARILLVEASDRVLPPYPPRLSEMAQRQLERLGVTVLLGRRVTAVDAEGITANGERIEARTVIWCAGVAASPLGALLAVPTDSAGRVIVDPDLSIPGHPEIQVIGDLASVPSHRPPVPGTAPAAKQMGRHAAKNVLARLAGRKASAFRYCDYGELATIGRSAAVARFPHLQFWGWPAWLLWLFAHVYFLIGFRNRIVVAIDWAWAYFTFKRYARIVVGPTTKEEEGAAPPAPPPR